MVLKRCISVAVALILMAGTGAFTTGTASATTSYGRPVAALGSNTYVGNYSISQHWIYYYNPLSYTGIYDVTLISGSNYAGMFSDVGSGSGIGNASLTMFLRFEPVDVPAATASLVFYNIDLDLQGSNDPDGFLEAVQFFQADGTTPISSLISISTDSALAPFPYNVSTSGSYSQTITFTDITSIVANPFFVKLEWSSCYHYVEGEGCTWSGRNTQEKFKATLTSTPIPEPATILLLGSGLLGLGLGMRRRLS